MDAIEIAREQYTARKEIILSVDQCTALLKMLDFQEGNRDENRVTESWEHWNSGFDIYLGQKVQKTQNYDLDRAAEDVPIMYKCLMRRYAIGGYHASPKA